tara:strand:+ start:919 stop:1275 length:357 start_codon:yes stop_codon:yes gene_type:complete
MPIYQFRHPEYPIVIEEVQKMTDPHVYVDSEGIEWVRIFTVPNASIDSQPDPFDSKRFVEATKDTGGTYGDLLDRAKEASEKRTQKLGYDPVKKEYFKNYSKNRNGMKHLKEGTEGNK